MSRSNRVYFIRPVGMEGPIKIGCSYSPDGRRKTLETWSPFALEIVAEIEGGFKLERRFHALFAETHQRREWFGWSKRLATVIAAINNGTFDIASLPAPMKLCVTGAGSKRGRQWTDEERERHSLTTRLRRAERGAGLVLDWGASVEEREAFIANPCRATGGITAEERTARTLERRATYHDREAERWRNAARPTTTDAKAAA